MPPSRTRPPFVRVAGLTLAQLEEYDRQCAVSNEIVAHSLDEVGQHPDFTSAAASLRWMLIHLDTGGLPSPDLVIRTSGERRMSGVPAVADRRVRPLILRRVPAGRADF